MSVRHLTLQRSHFISFLLKTCDIEWLILVKNKYFMQNSIFIGEIQHAIQPLLYHISRISPKRTRIHAHFHQRKGKKQYIQISIKT